MLKHTLHTYLIARGFPYQDTLQLLYPGRRCAKPCDLPPWQLSMSHQLNTSFLSKSFTSPFNVAMPLFGEAYSSLLEEGKLQVVKRPSRAVHGSCFSSL